MPEFRAFDYGALGRALAIGALGGAVFAWLNMPLAWMIGAMCATTAASVSGVNVKMLPALRTLMIAVLGVMLGGAFHPEIVEQMARWSLSLSVLFIYMVMIAGLVMLYFRKVMGYDPATAYFSAIPGGLNEMVLVGGSMGGEDHTIALTHASRILLVVMVIPFWFRLVEGYQPSASSAGAPFVTIPTFDLGVMALCGFIGFFVARLVKLPAPALIGPMVMSAAAQLTGLTTSRPPVELINIAQVVVGTGIGCRFAGVPMARMARAMSAAAGSTIIMLGSAVAFAVTLHAAIGLPTEALVLAFAPGGLAEMTLIALSLGIDPAFVSTHHVVRIILVVVLAPLAFRLLAPKLGIGGGK
ncbi:MAG: AbrB family transcriptional regulator [Pseudomonadota bacterium]|nr:AbrB family transcriptional regulator [Pseudomonadota bacterium]